jgi:DNA-binding NtrC family response regulator
MKKMRILVVEDGRSQREILRDFLAGEGYLVSEAHNGEQALETIKRDYFDLVLLDYKMPGKDGMAVLKEIKGFNTEIDVIMMTAHGTIETAVKAMKAGAADYITKPIELDELLLQIEKISDFRNLTKENKILREDLRGKGITTDHIVYKSSAINEVINLAGRVSRSDTTVLIKGETGTGKELFARLVHTLSPRSEKLLITVNCAALPETLLESELFGHEKGAFTGASRRRIGRFEEADEGTLFLDEIGELSPSVQVKLLRFLQEREFQRVGGNQTIRSDVRIISATNRDLEVKVKGGDFREDLYYRLNVVAMTIPPLRDRKEDLPPLIDHFLKHFAKQMGEEMREIDPDARDLLLRYDYPGNVRELENIIERAVVISRGPVISSRDLPFTRDDISPRGGDYKPATQSAGKSAINAADGPDRLLKTAVDDLERTMIRKAMEETDNHQTRAADILGISERMLRYKLKKYGLK